MYILKVLSQHLSCYHQLRLRLNLFDKHSISSAFLAYLPCHFVITSSLDKGPTININSNSLTGLTINVLKQLQNTLQVPVSHELNAFCHLCPAALLAAPKLLELSKDKLLHLSQACREAIN